MWRVVSIAEKKAQPCAAWQAQPQAHSKSSGRRIYHAPNATAHSRNCACAAARGDQLMALILDCDGVIVESEDLHREAYNAAFAHFKACIGGKQDVIAWSEEFYDDLQNKVGGGKAKMRWYFGEHGWPCSIMFSEAPKSQEQQTALIDALQEWKSKKFQEIVGSDAEARPGIMRLMDEARQASIKVAVCSAATKSSVIHVVKSLLGEERFEALDVFLAGDDVPAKKPDPSIYTLAAERLGVQPSECLVVEDSAIGLQAAVDAGMRCIITYTYSSHSQRFLGAELIVSDLDAASHPGARRRPKRLGRNWVPPKLLPTIRKSAAAGKTMSAQLDFSIEQISDNTAHNRSVLHDAIQVTKGKFLTPPSQHMVKCLQDTSKRANTCGTSACMQQEVTKIVILLWTNAPVLPSNWSREILQSSANQCKTSQVPVQRLLCHVRRVLIPDLTSQQTVLAPCGGIVQEDCLKLCSFVSADRIAGFLAGLCYLNECRTEETMQQSTAPCSLK
ncbi:hypothetical protein WJX77_002440 [Trebouxia sp. C0004]